VIWESLENIAEKGGDSIAEQINGRLLLCPFLYKRDNVRLFLYSSGYFEQIQSVQEQPRQNLILASLPKEDLRRLESQMKEVLLPLNEVVISPEDPIQYVYFPQGALISLVSLMEDGKSVEAGLIGLEGMAGLPVVLADGTTPMRSVVQIEGAAIQMRSGVVKEEFQRGGALQNALHRYMHALFVEFSQSAACNRLHPIIGRLSRWLLMASDAVASEKLFLTHDYLSVMLGIRRPGVTEAAVELRERGGIDYSRGEIRIVNRKVLEGIACECYEFVKKEFDRMYTK
jgi:CRP-like cAMP-binding protein